MEKQGISFGSEQHEIDTFLQFGTTPEHHEECLTPLKLLPYSFRNEIEKGYTTGWRGLDYYLQGFRLGEITVITADTGVGKTTFCTQVMINCAMQNIPVWINSWEMKPETIMRKLASIVLKRPLKMCKFNDHENEQLDTWSAKYQVYINKNTIGTDIDAFSKQLIKARDLGIKMVMIDHLDYLVNVRKDKLHEAIDETIKRLHELCFALRMHFLLICHPRQSASNAEEVGLHSLKGSSSIKQYADNVLILHRCNRSDAKAQQNKVKIRVAKNRMFGTEGNAYLYYQPVWDGYLDEQ